MSFFKELKRRNVFKVAIAYIIVAWLLLQVSDTLVPALYLPDDVATRYNLACFYTNIGEYEKALDFFENSISSRSWIENDPDLEPLRDHPRFQAVLDALSI